MSSCSRVKAVVLLSGGIDSTVTLFLAIKEGFDCHCLVFDYGQRHRREINSAKAVAEFVGVPYKILCFTLPWGGSPLLGRDGVIPKDRDMGGIPQTYVPGRNTIFLGFAISFAEAIGAQSIFIGANCVDYSGYPDCRPQYLKAYNELIKVGTKAGVEGGYIKIEAPLIEMRKRDIVRLGMRLNVPFEKTWSCYEGGSLPCGRCDACIFRAKGFDEAGVKDPLLHG